MTKPIDEQIAKGKEWADVLKLRRDFNTKDRYQTLWGNKTPLGIYATIIRLVEDDKASRHSK